VAAASIILEARDLVKTYRAGAGVVEALRGVSFSVERGTVVAIMGPSGSGKTTLLNLISGLDRPTRGHVTVLGHSLDQLQGDAATDFRRRHIGFVFQFFNLIPTMIAADNVALPMLADGKSRADIARRVPEMLRKVGLADRANRQATELSGGEMQRVAIARALVMDPPLVLADEPTGNLDSVTGDAILDLLCTASREEGRAVVLVTHSYRTTAYADRILSVCDGRVVEELVPEQSPEHAHLMAVIDREATLRRRER
jgi:putative ABC transport system ATP-binding protein